ncbi:MAG TPA: hypothetical protein VNE67_09185 [Acetobacteraceae bacterium]|nr:hypothetical protein [Acetobacteraceae bacterium]
MLDIATLARPMAEPPLSEILADAARALELSLRDAILITLGRSSDLESELTALVRLLRKGSRSAARLEERLQQRQRAGRLRLLLCRCAFLIGWSVPS